MVKWEKEFATCPPHKKRLANIIELKNPLQFFKLNTNKSWFNYILT